ncbi:hypothetical protein PoB_006969200 [Plakobranchus ocellatus]|uniref:Uncharacterized protein n=1 Tax=Plakobranchus ocellatus TaxID=259542 RepID=A0AAV4DG38_9GAST|nr:hypothetical protein PoB_006969200 [Plakobranchus ocellatus]
MSWQRMTIFAVFTSSLIYLGFLSTSKLQSDSAHSKRQLEERRGLIPYTVLNRGHAVRDRELSRAREALEYWWSIRKDDSNGAAGACPLSVSGPPQMSQEGDESRQVFYQLQAISVMEAIGFTNVTTCGGRYPRIIVDIQALRDGKDNVYTTANYSTEVTSPPPSPTDAGIPSAKIQAALITEDKQADELIRSKFCYTPVFRPFQSQNVEKSGQDVGEEGRPSQPPKPMLSPKFCPELLQLHRDIEAGVQPPLLTLFTWIPDPIQDQYKLSRHIMLLNLEMLRPFVRPVLVSDRRMIMAIAHGMGWPCLPLRELSPDNLPVFRPIAEDIMDKFNSTFYGYAQATSAFDTSLLETLMAVKQKFFPNNAENSLESNKASEHPEQNQADVQAPNIIIHGSAMYRNNLQTVKKFSDLGVQAAQRGRRDWEDKESSMVYFFHTKMDFSDLPSLKIEDKYLSPFLVTRSRMLGHVVVDASRTILCLLNHVVRRRPAWNRVDLPTKPRDEKYNPRLAVSYIKSLKQQVAGITRKNKTLVFDSEWNIIIKIA